MEDSTKSSILNNCKSCMKKLCSAKVKDSFSFSMKVTSDDDTSCFDKTISSQTEFNLVKTLSALMIIGAAISLICAVCSVFKK